LLFNTNGGAAPKRCPVVFASHVRNRVLVRFPGSVHGHFCSEQEQIALLPVDDVHEDVLFFWLVRSGFHQYISNIRQVICFSVNHHIAFLSR
jgi:hypothetical protein